jgi:hypothetical protein
LRAHVARGTVAGTGASYGVVFSDAKSYVIDLPGFATCTSVPRVAEGWRVSACRCLVRHKWGGEAAVHHPIHSHTLEPRSG